MWAFLAIVGGALLVLVIANLSTSEKKIEQEIEHCYSVHDPEFARSLGTLLGPAILAGNSVTPLINGDQIFPAMLDAIRRARCTITFETFIYWSGEIGKEFAGALIGRAEAGVHVHLLLDWLGTGRMDKALLQQMEQAGVTVVKYHPLHWNNLGRLNNRTHRKLLVIDGQVGFTGGVGIADNWLGNAQDPYHWRDSQSNALAACRGQ